MTCERSSNFPVTKPLNSNVAFIKVPGKLLEGEVVVRSVSMLPLGQHLIIIPLNNSLGNFNISAILDGDNGKIYDIYYYYGLDPSLPGPTNKKITIGSATNNGGILNVSLIDDFFRDDYLDTLERYRDIEIVRKKLEMIN